MPRRAEWVATVAHMPPRLTGALTFFTVSMAALIAGLAPDNAPRWSLIVLAAILLVPAVGLALYHWREWLSEVWWRLNLPLGRIAERLTKPGRIRRTRRHGMPPIRIAKDGSWICPYSYDLNRRDVSRCRVCQAERIEERKVMPPPDWDPHHPSPASRSWGKASG
jgi:hypothetical protein